MFSRKGLQGSGEAYYHVLYALGESPSLCFSQMFKLKQSVFLQLLDAFPADLRSWDWEEEQTDPSAYNWLWLFFFFFLNFSPGSLQDAKHKNNKGRISSGNINFPSAL